MHTIVMSKYSGWDVIFKTSTGWDDIETQMSKDDAIQLVNYLNGGRGYPIPENKNENS